MESILTEMTKFDVRLMALVDGVVYQQNSLCYPFKECKKAIDSLAVLNDAEQRVGTYLEIIRQILFDREATLNKIRIAGFIRHQEPDGNVYMMPTTRPCSDEERAIVWSNLLVEMSFYAGSLEKAKSYILRKHRDAKDNSDSREKHSEVANTTFKFFHDNLSLLKLLFDRMLDKYIHKDTSFDKFETVFSGAELPVDRIFWQGTQKELSYFVEGLFSKKLVISFDRSRRFDIARSVFSHPTYLTNLHKPGAFSKTTNDQIFLLLNTFLKELMSKGVKIDQV